MPGGDGRQKGPVDALEGLAEAASKISSPSLNDGQSSDTDYPTGGARNSNSSNPYASDQTQDPGSAPNGAPGRRMPSYGYADGGQVPHGSYGAPPQHPPGPPMYHHSQGIPPQGTIPPLGGWGGHYSPEAHTEMPMPPPGYPQPHQQPGLTPMAQAQSQIAPPPGSPSHLLNDGIVEKGEDEAHLYDTSESKAGRKRRKRKSLKQPLGRPHKMMSPMTQGAPPPPGMGYPPQPPPGHTWGASPHMGRGGYPPNYYKGSRGAQRQQPMSQYAQQHMTVLQQQRVALASASTYSYHQQGSATVSSAKNNPSPTAAQHGGNGKVANEKDPSVSSVDVEQSEAAMLMLKTKTQNPILLAEKLLGPRPSSREKSKLNAWNYRYKKLMKTGYEDIRKALQNIRRHQTRVRDKIRREEEILAEHGRVMSAKQRKEYQDMLDDLEEKKHVLEAKRRKINEDEKMYQRQCRELKKMSGVKPDDASDDGEEDEKAPSSSIPRVDDLSSLNGEKAGRSEPSGSRRKRAVDEEKPAEIEGDPSLKRMQHSGSSIPITEYSAV